jgi:hypothetical protein
MYEIIFEKSVECAESVLTAVLHVNAKRAETGIELVERLVNRETIVINVGFCNNEWQGVLTCGGSLEDLQGIVGETDQHVVVDALGEVLNSVAGLIAISPEAKETFGELSQTTPVAMIGGTFFPKAPGVQLDMNIANNRLRFGFAIRHVMVMN